METSKRRKYSAEKTNVRYFEMSLYWHGFKNKKLF